MVRRRILPLGLALFLVLTVSVSAIVDWPMERHDMQRTGYLEAESNYNTDEIILLWVYNTNGPIYTSPALYDLNSDGKLEVIFGSDDGFLYVLSHEGDIVWLYNAGARIRSSPTVTNFTGQMNVVFGSDDGKVHVLNATGGLIWTFETEKAVRTSPLITNLDETPDKELIIGSYDHRIYKIKPDGTSVWNYDTREPVESSPAATDIDADGKTEFIIGSGNSVLYGFKTLPLKVWTFPANCDFSFTPVIDVARDIIVGCDSNVVYNIDFTSIGNAGTKRTCTNDGCYIENIPMTGFAQGWRFNTTEELSTAVAVADVDNQSTSYEIVFGAGKSLYVIHENLNKSFIYTVGKKIQSAPILVDLNGDDMLEIIFGTNEGRVYVLNYSGHALYNHNTEGPVKASPSAGDLTGDGSVEFLVTSEKGLIYAFGSWKVKIIEEANLQLNQAWFFHGLTNLEGTLEYSQKALDIYSSVNYTQGVRQARMLMNVVQADKLFNGGDLYYSQGEMVSAAQEFQKAQYIYDQLNYSVGANATRSMLKRIDADTYLLEASFYYDSDQFDNATQYAVAARNIYQQIGYNSGIKNALSLINKSNNHEQGDNFFVQGVNAYHDRNLEVALKYFTQASTAYSDAGYLDGMEKSTTFINRLEGDEAYIKATGYFNESNYEDAYDFAEQAKQLYAEYDLTEDYVKAELLMNMSSAALNAFEAYDSALRYYEATDYRSSTEYALRAMKLFNESRDNAGYERSLELYNTSSTRLELILGDSASEGLNPLVVLIAVLVLVIVFIAFRKGKVINPGETFNTGKAILTCGVRGLTGGAGFSMTLSKRRAERLSYHLEDINKAKPKDKPRKRKKKKPKDDFNNSSSLE